MRGWRALDNGLKGVSHSHTNLLCSLLKLDVLKDLPVPVTFDQLRWEVDQEPRMLQNLTDGDALQGTKCEDAPDQIFTFR